MNVENKAAIYGAILGDLCGQPFEHKFEGEIPSKEIEPFTEFTSRADDTIEKVEQIFYSTNSTHEAIKLAVSLGGDTDTVASIVGALSAYHYQDITLKDIEYIKWKLDEDLNLILSKI